MRQPRFISILFTVCMLSFASAAHAGRWYVYHDYETAEEQYRGHGEWTNVMPKECGTTDITTIKMDDTSNPANETAIRLDFKIPVSPGWCGLVVTSKNQFWGKKPDKAGTRDLTRLFPGFDLTPYNKLVYMARGEKEDEVIEVKFAITGEQGDVGYSDSAPLPIDCGSITLSKEWKKYTCDLIAKIGQGGKISADDRSLFLGRVITPFVVVVSKSANPKHETVVFYLDEIYFE